MRTNKENGILKKVVFKIEQAISTLRIGADKSYLVMVDGGICSQMNQYLTGYLLHKEGHSVKFDLSWYQTCGKDIDGNHARNFDLLAMFPTIWFEEAKPSEIEQYRHFHSYYVNRAQECFDFKNPPKPPRYLGGYWYEKNVETLEPLYQEVFGKFDAGSLPDQTNRDKYHQLQSEEFSVGVHVRRGDMAKKGEYWKVLTPQYFVDAIKQFQGTDACFYFFSDDMDWVTQEILPLVPEIRYHLVEGNASDKGWCDLILLSGCRHQIASQGSLGKIAYLLNTRPGKQLVAPGTEDMLEWKQKMSKVQITILELSDRYYES